MIALSSLLELPGLTADLRRVEETLREAVRSDDAFLSEVASHLLDAGGKRLRPALAVTAGTLGAGPARQEVVLGAAAVELVHLGSLYHDDVIDEARTRRSVETVNARWGNLVAILAGDFLLARASEIAAGLGTDASALLAATIARLCEGQVRELRHAFDVDRSEDSYLGAIEGKTAALMAAACRIGALAAQRPQPEVEALTAYGRSLGMAFQIVDDVLDVVATDEELGKPAGNDLTEGVYTLPVIRALADDRTAAELRGLLGKAVTRDDVDRARALVRSNGAVSAACAVAHAYAADAARALETLPPGDGVDALAALGDRLVDTIPA